VLSRLYVRFVIEKLALQGSLHETVQTQSGRPDKGQIRGTSTDVNDCHCLYV